MSATAVASASSRSKRRSFDLAHRGGDSRVVDRVREPVVRAAVADLELDVVEEAAGPAALLLLDAVDSRAARARVSSTFIRATARRSRERLDVLAHVVGADDRRARGRTRRPPRRPTPPSSPSRSASRRAAPSELLREKPIRTGRPSAASSPSRRTSSKLCAAVLPKPIPGSRQIELLAGSPLRRRTRAAPRGSASRRRRRRRTSGSPASCAARPACASGRGSTRRRRRRPPAPGSPRSAVTSLTSSTPSSSARRATAAFDVSIETGRPPRSASTGSTRASSCSAVTPPDPGRVDSPPTSTIAAPASSIPHAAVTASVDVAGTRRRRRTSRA